MERRAIFTREFWRDYALEFRRLRKDRRARRSFIFRNLLLVFLLLYAGYYVAIVRSLHDPTTELALGIVLLVIVAIIASVRWSQYREQQRTLAADIASVSPETALHLQRLAFGLAAVMERALSELWLQKHSVPEGHEIITRRIQLETLRKRGVWEEVPLPAQDWMVRPDHSWPEERIAQVLASAEILHTLLWTLALTRTLRPLEQLGEPLSFQKISAQLQSSAPGIRPSWDLRLERSKAEQYYLRCHAENIYRGDVAAASEEQKDAVTEWVREIESGRSPNSFAGSLTIGETEADTLHQIARSAACRARTLYLVMQLLDEQEVWEELRAFVYAPLIVELHPAASSAEL